MRIWSILLIKSDLKWCIHLSRSLYLYFNYLVSVTASGPRSPRGHMKPSSTVDFGRFIAFWEHQNFLLKLIEIVILCVYYTIPFGFSFFRHSLGIMFQLFQYKIQKNWCTLTVTPKIEHHGGHSRTPANQRRDQVPGRSQRLPLG